MMRLSNKVRKTVPYSDYSEANIVMLYDDNRPITAEEGKYQLTSMMIQFHYDNYPTKPYLFRSELPAQIIIEPDNKVTVSIKDKSTTSLDRSPEEIIERFFPEILSNLRIEL